MIQFFRHIRKRLLSENKFSKYLLYAIGEIVLVVIGILIALQINNWNENQKDRQAENQALINLKLEFDENQNHLDGLMKRRQSQEKQCRTYIALITDPSIPISQKISASPPSTNAITWRVKTTVLNSLVNTGGIDRIQNDSLKFLLTNWPTLVDRFNEIENRFVHSIDKISDYEDNVTPASVVNKGDYREGEWPGNYYPPGIEETLGPMKKKLIEDIKYYNLLANLTNNLYVYSIHGTRLRNNYERISKLIIEELNSRSIQIP